MKKEQFKKFLSTLRPDSQDVKSKLEALTTEFKDYFYFNTYSHAWHISDKKNNTTIEFTFSFFIPQLNSEKTIEIFSQNYIYGEKRHGHKKIRLKAFSLPSIAINSDEIEPFNAAVKMYGVEPQYQELYNELSTDNTNLHFNNKEINYFAKAEQFTEYVNKVRNEYIMPYLLNKMENDLVEVKIGENIISIHISKEVRTKFIKGVSEAFTKLISDIDNKNISSLNMTPVLQALDEHNNRNHTQWLDSQLPAKEDSKRLKKI